MNSFKSLTLITIVLFIVTSCSKNDNNVEPKFVQKTNSKAFVMSYDETKLMDNSVLEITVPTSNDFLNNFVNYQAYYKVTPDSDWEYLTHVNLEKNYSLGIFMNFGPEDPKVEMNIELKNKTTRETYESSIKYSNIEIIGIKTSEIKKIPAGTLNIRDYNEVIKYFEL